MRSILVIATLLGGGVASAQTAEDKAAAETLFQDGRKLAQAGKYAEACPKFEASLRLDPAPGTELNLADCYEKTNRFASAFGTFRQAADDFRRAADHDAEKLARDRAAQLEPKLSRLTLQSPLEVAPGLIVSRNGVRVDPALLGTPMPVDVGSHRIACFAPGRKTWTQDVAVKVGESLTIVLPVLVVEVAVVGPAQPPTAPPEPAPVPVTPPIKSVNSELQVTVAEPAAHYDVEVVTATGVLRCDRAVTHDQPCKLTAPPGPAVITLHGTASLTEDLVLKGGKPVLVSVDTERRYLLYGGLISAGAGAGALGVGVYACSQRNDHDIQDNTPTGLTCLIGSTLGGAAVVAGGALILWDLLSEHRSITTHSSDDDEAHRMFTAPIAHGAVVGMVGRF